MTLIQSDTPTEPRPAEDDADAPGPPLRLLISCPDQPGIVHAVSRYLYNSGGNILTSDQYTTDPQGGTFFLRTEFTLPLAARRRFAEGFADGVARQFAMDWQLWDSARRKRVGVLVSRYDHCLQDLLWRWRRGELDAELVLVASNWEDLRDEVQAAGLPFHHIPVPKGAKPQAEARLLELLRDACDLTVLARYMQVLSSDFLDAIGMPVINIHHSFLPAFAGAGPYDQAKRRGVKLIGATAHYVTPELDAGPIIEQDVARVTHAHTVGQLTQIGAEIERTVLARAVQWHCEDRVMRHDNATIVF